MNTNSSTTKLSPSEELPEQLQEKIQIQDEENEAQKEEIVIEEDKSFEVINAESSEKESKIVEEII